MNLERRSLIDASGFYCMHRDGNRTNQVKSKKQLSLGELSQPGARVKITEQIQHRLHRTSGSNSTVSEVCMSFLFQTECSHAGTCDSLQLSLPGFKFSSVQVC